MRSSATVLATLLTAAVLVPDSSAWAAGKGKAQQLEDEEKQSFVRKHFPVKLNEELHEKVEEIKIKTYLLNLLPFGGFWSPLLLLDDMPESTSEVGKAYFIPCAGSIAVWMVFAVPAGCIMVIPYIGWVLGPGICALGALAAAFPALWIAPTASLNAWDDVHKNPELYNWKPVAGASKPKANRPKRKPTTDSYDY